VNLLIDGVFRIVGTPTRTGPVVSGTDFLARG
jgi:hypothetical protein